MRMCAWDFYFPEAVAIAFWQQNELHSELIKNLKEFPSPGFRTPCPTLSPNSHTLTSWIYLSAIYQA